MKKSSIVMLVFASLLVLVGFAVMVGGVIPFHYVRYYDGYMLRYSSFGDGYQFSRLVFGGFLFTAGVILFAGLAVVQSLTPSRKQEAETKKVPRVEAKKAQNAETKIPVKAEEETEEKTVEPSSVENDKQ